MGDDHCLSTGPRVKHHPQLLLGLFAISTLVACGQDSAQSASQSAEPACAGMASTEMVWVPGGEFAMGEKPRYPEEGPPSIRQLPGFWMDAHEVTNAQFAAFVQTTGYKTLAERDPPKPESIQMPIRLDLAVCSIWTVGLGATRSRPLT